MLAQSQFLVDCCVKCRLSLCLESKANIAMAALPHLQSFKRKQQQDDNAHDVHIALRKKTKMTNTATTRGVKVPAVAAPAAVAAVAAVATATATATSRATAGEVKAAGCATRRPKSALPIQSAGAVWTAVTETKQVRTEEGALVKERQLLIGLKNGRLVQYLGWLLFG